MSEAITYLEEIKLSAVAGKGAKADLGKLRYDLLPTEAVREVVRVLNFGATKYADENWRKVPNWRRRYYAAAMRHINDWWDGTRDKDEESGLDVLAHAVCCLIFLMEQERNGVCDCGGQGCGKCAAMEATAFTKCGIPGCDGVVGPDITGRPICYSCGPKDMIPRSECACADCECERNCCGE